MERMCQFLRYVPSLNMGSTNGSLPELDGTGYRATTMEENINENYLQLPLFLQNTFRIENCVPDAFSNSAQTTKITGIEQIVGSLVARVTYLETGAASGSCGPDSARSTLVTPELSVPGVSPEVLQRVHSQANKVNV